MAEERELPGSQESVDGSNSANIEFFGNEASIPSPAIDKQVSITERFRKISGVLPPEASIRKAPSSALPSTLPGISDSLGDIVERLKAPPKFRAKTDVGIKAIDAPAINFPDEKLPGHIKLDDTLSEVPTATVRTEARDWKSVDSTNSLSTSTRSDFPLATDAILDDGASRAEWKQSGDEKHSQARTVAPVATAQARLGSHDEPSAKELLRFFDHRVTADVLPIQTGSKSPDVPDGAASGLPTGMTTANELLSESYRPRIKGMVLPADASKSPVESRAIGIDSPYELCGGASTSELRQDAEVEGSGNRVSTPTLSGGELRSSIGHAGPSINLVRNPVSTELRNLSMSSESSPEEVASLSDSHSSGRFFRDEPLGSLSSPQEATQVDLSKTNELLQQLIAAMRNQSNSSLPSGGPSVYPGR